MKIKPFLVIFQLLLGAPLAAHQQPITYSVDLTKANTHYITVTMTSVSAGDETEIMMPVWTPGSYSVREFARHVEQISAKDAEGNLLPIRKINKNRWQIDTSSSDNVTVEYRVYCHDRSVRTNWVSHDYAVLNGAPTFVTIPEFIDRPHQVQLVLPDVWKRSATSLRLHGDRPHSYIASNYHELVDSPIVAGALRIYPFNIGGVQHQLVNVNEIGFWDGSRAARDLARVVEEHHKVWGNVPYDRYLFLNVVGGGGGGLEHDNCCLMMASRWACGSDESYQRWLSLASHEFFHTWNIRRLRPRSLVKYDYERETYTPSLWIAEGITSYYQDLLLARAGLIDRKKLIKDLSSSISRLQTAEGRNVQSLRDSSHDSWIKFYRPSENSRDTTISYYTKGAVVGLLLDVEIRKASGGKKSLDDAMRLLYERHSGNVGYDPSDFRAICTEVSGNGLMSWFESAVDSTAELDYQNLCDWFGMKVGDISPTVANSDDEKEPAEENGDVNIGEEEKPTDESKNEDTKSGQDNKDDDKNDKPWLGITTSDAGASFTISGVEPDSPARDAGLVLRDEILAIDDVRIKRNLDSRLQHYKVGQQITLLIAREDRLLEVPITIAARQEKPDWKLQLVRKPTDQQTANLDTWLGKEKKNGEEKKGVEGADQSSR